LVAKLHIVVRQSRRHLGVQVHSGQPGQDVEAGQQDPLDGPIIPAFRLCLGEQVGHTVALGGWYQNVHIGQRVGHAVDGRGCSGKHRPGDAGVVQLPGNFFQRYCHVWFVSFLPLGG